MTHTARATALIAESQREGREVTFLPTTNKNFWSLYKALGFHGRAQHMHPKSTSDTYRVRFVGAGWTVVIDSQED